MTVVHRPNKLRASPPAWYVARVNVRSEPTGASGYLGLRETALQILADAPEGLESAELARRLFGAGSGARWVALLPGVLGGDDRLACIDGRWRLARRHDTVSRPAVEASASPDAAAGCDAVAPEADALLTDRKSDV